MQIMNANSNSTNMNERIFMRIVNLCNWFWYFMLTLAVVLLATVLIRLELYAHSRVALVVYLGAPVLLFAVAVGMLKLVSPLQRLNVSLLAASVVFSAFLIEIYLGFYGHVDLRSIKALASGVQVDSKTRKEVIEKLRNEGRQAYLTIHPRPLLQRNPGGNEWHSILSIEGQEVLPLGGIASVDTVYNRESGQWVVYRSDEYGFRNPSGTWSHDDFDLVVIGDSFAHGAGLMDGEDVVSLLRNDFPHTVNLGNGGNGPLMVFATLREYGQKLKPHFVVYLYFEGNDLRDLDKEKDSPLLMRYLLDPSWSQNLYEHHKAVNTILLDFGEKQVRKYYVENPLDRLRQILALSNLRGRIGLNFTAKRKLRNLQPDLVLLEDILQRTREEVQTWGGTFVVAYLPAWKRYKNPDNYHMYRSNVLNILKNNKIPVVDLYPVFQKQNDVFSLFHFGLDGHYNKIGARLVAEEVRKGLNEVYRETEISQRPVSRNKKEAA